VVNYAVSIQQPLPEFPHSIIKLPYLPTPGPSGGGENIEKFHSREGSGVGPPLSSPPGRGKGWVLLPVPLLGGVRGGFSP